MLGRPAATNRAMARRVVTPRSTSARRVATIACVAALAGVAVIGMLHPLSAAGGDQPAATPAATAAGAAGIWGTGDAAVGMNWMDLIPKVMVVLVLLFITLRVLGKMGNGGQKKGGRMQVLESRTLAPKASLHLVAIGDRRLVVGLTPSGMVSLAELDANELAAEESATAAAIATDAATAGSSLFGGAANKMPAQPSFVTALNSALNSALMPLDAVAGRLATFFSAGRVR